LKYWFEDAIHTRQAKTLKYQNLKENQVENLKDIDFKISS
jgi:hypothetical protein